VPTADLIAERRRKEIAKLRQWRIASAVLATVPWCVVLFVDYAVSQRDNFPGGSAEYFFSSLILPACVTIGIALLLCSDSRLRQSVGHVVGFIWPFALHLRYANGAWPAPWDRGGALALATMCLFLGTFIARSINGFLAFDLGVFGRAIQFSLKDLFVLTTYGALLAATVRSM
jgi:hypothetical protein